MALSSYTLKYEDFKGGLSIPYFGGYIASFGFGGQY